MKGRRMIVGAESRNAISQQIFHLLVLLCSVQETSWGLNYPEFSDPLTRKGLTDNTYKCWDKATNDNIQCEVKKRKKETKKERNWLRGKKQMPPPWGPPPGPPGGICDCICSLLSSWWVLSMWMWSLWL